MLTRARLATFVIALIGGLAGNWLSSGAQAQPVPIPGRGNNNKALSVQSVDIVDEGGVTRARLDARGLVIMDAANSAQVYMTLNTAGLTMVKGGEQHEVSYLSEAGLRMSSSTSENNIYTSLDEASIMPGLIRTSQLNLVDRSSVDELRLHPSDLEIGSRRIFERRRVPGVPNPTEAQRRGEVTMLRVGHMADNKEVGLRATRLDRGMTIYHSSGKPYYRVGVVDNLANNLGYSFAEFLDAKATSRMALGWSNSNKAAIYFYDADGKPVENLGGK